MITKPQLPPRIGYVEIENEDGEHIYKAVEANSDTEVAALRAEITGLNAIVDTLIIDNLGGGGNV